MNLPLKYVFTLFLVTIFLCANLNNSIAQEYSEDEFEQEFLADFEDFGSSNKKTDEHDPGTRHRYDNKQHRLLYR